MEVWKCYFSRGYTHVKETRFTAAQSYKKHETINLFFDDSGQLVNFRYSRNLPKVMTDEARWFILIVCLSSLISLLYL